MTDRCTLAAALTTSVFAAAHALGQSISQAPMLERTVPVDVSSPVVVARKSPERRKVSDGSSHRGVLLRSNVALVAAKVGGVGVSHPQYGGLLGYRFATINHISLGYGWRKDFAPTIDGFRLVVPHYPSNGDATKFEMRVDAEVLGLGLGTTSFYRPMSLHVGQTMGYMMGRVGGGLLETPKYKGFGGLVFVGYELMRSQRIGIVLYVQMMNVLLFDGEHRLTTRSLGASLGVTYW